MAVNLTERRNSSRTYYPNEVICEGSGINRFSTRISDISLTGAFIDSLQCVPPGTMIKVRFRGPTRDLLIAAEVRYALPPMGMGIQFVNLSLEDENEIRLMTK